jgi:hypothetical protein
MREVNKRHSAVKNGRNRRFGIYYGPESYYSAGGTSGGNNKIFNGVNFLEISANKPWHTARAFLFRSTDI